jgi:hypothetical protein
MSWRLEPTPRSPGVEEGLAARVHDPLWFLARQWQVGEFQGKDAGTPAIVQVSGSSTPVNAWRGAQQTAWTPFDPAGEPLNALVEPEDEAQPDLRERIEAGAYFLRLLNAAGLSRLGPAFVSAHAFAAADLALPDFAADPLLAALARRVPDGLLLYATAVALVGGSAQPVPINGDDLPTVVTAATTWLAWYTAELPVTTGTGTAVTWQEHRMEYGFAVSSPAAGGTVLVADQYLGDGLDWFDFDIDPGAAIGPDAPTIPITAKAVPTPVRYGGMPLPRFWAMEDSQYDFGSIEAAANDIGRLLLVEFATVFGNDWHVLPIKVQVGTLTTLDSVVASDVFGRNLVLSRAGQNDPQWNLFSLDTRGAAHPAQDALFMPPTAAYVGESHPVETVLFLRDQMADLAWGVELLVQDGLERVVNRRSTWTAPARPPSGTRDVPAYRVETVVPDYWIPLAPEQLPDQQSIHLRLVPLEVDDGGTESTANPKGRVLVANDSDGNLWLYDEEVPREGIQVDRVYRYARWLDGRTSLWSARRRGTGAGEGSSGLRFDILDPSS